MIYLAKNHDDDDNDDDDDDNDSDIRKISVEYRFLEKMVILPYKSSFSLKYCEQVSITQGSIVLT